MSHDTAHLATIVREIAHFLRDEWVSTEHFEPWPGLPSTPGAQPTLEQANFFFLGCCVDLQERYKVAWERARRFFTEIVPPADRPLLWRWICDHSETEWVRQANTYKLHRFPAFHKRLHRIAGTLQEHFGGDPRTIWAPHNAHRILPILTDDLKVGAALSRMIVGALRDHQLIDLGTSEFKPDRHICRQMHRLGLSPTSKPADVLTAAKKYFPDPWLVDTALFYLSAEYDVVTPQGVLNFYRQMTTWTKQRPDIAKEMPTLKNVILQNLGKEAWAADIDLSQHWVGLCLTRTDGPLRNPMNVQDGSTLWAWIGVGFDGHLVSGIHLGGEETFLNSLALRRKLKSLQFGPGEESRDPFSSHLSFWQQQPLSPPDHSHLLSRFKEMAETACSLILTIEEVASPQKKTAKKQE